MDATELDVEVGSQTIRLAGMTSSEEAIAGIEHHLHGSGNVPHCCRRTERLADRDFATRDTLGARRSAIKV
jgi:hypothetical protein